jgi:hypothetical protein
MSSGHPSGSSTWRWTNRRVALCSGREGHRLAEDRPTRQAVRGATREVVRGHLGAGVRAETHAAAEGSRGGRLRRPHDTHAVEVVAHHVHGLNFRQYFPKKTDLSLFTLDEVQAAVDELNDRPRQVLGWKTAREVFDVATVALIA